MKLAPPIDFWKDENDSQKMQNKKSNVIPEVDDCLEDSDEGIEKENNTST
jgi:hypothetical protein